MVCLQSYQAVLGVVVFTWVRYGLGFSISNGISDIGVSQEIPARSGQNAQSINLECRLNFNSGEKMTLCKWVHSFPDVWAYDDREAFVMCIAAHESADGNVCEDQGNIFDENTGGYNDPLLNPYTAYDSTRLVHRMTENICGLTIRSPHANDTGIWKCHVNDNNPDVGTQWAEVDLFVANESVVAITDPDMYGNTGVSIEVDLSTSSRVDVDAECTAEYGIPPPDIIWYIDEPTNTVDGSSDQTEQSDGTVVSSVRLSLDQNSLSRYGIRQTNNYFSFALGCYPDQGDYFDSNRDDIKNPAEVLVFGTSGAQVISTSVVIVALVALLLFVSL
eukprot:TRINITY_DN33963_c0_g1_i1.p1 TRINITY_DN33963_c0_g1~~TRINITY_DN33963_c0_g1_i1.p1  ORF type:complete len:332 (-),score=61.33 TRINITY_DN33963_c0_g1_i1:24-1019(-)